MFLVDTNILLRISDSHELQSRDLAPSLRRLVLGGQLPVIAPQTLYEMWTVLTRDVERNGLGLSPKQAATRCRRLRYEYKLLEDPIELVDEWLTICETYAVKGKQAHDARLVAWMRLQGVSQILTLNPKDFARYPDIEIVDLDK